MNGPAFSTDEYAVGVLLSRFDARRDEAIRHLVDHPSARELLCMAQQALDALHLPTSTEIPPSALMNGRPSAQHNEEPGIQRTASFTNLRPSADRAPSGASAEAATAQRRSVLIVEDNPSTRILLVYMLKRTYEVSAAASFDEALNLVREKTFDGLVLDINLCESRTGVDLLHIIRQIPHYTNVPAIACTAYTNFGDRERLLESGFNQYVSKPFTKEQLHDALTLLFQQATRKPGLGSGLEA